MDGNDPTPSGSKEGINILLTKLQEEINKYLSTEDGPEHIFLYFEDKVKSKGRKQVEDIEGDVIDMKLL